MEGCRGVQEGGKLQIVNLASRSPELPGRGWRRPDRSPLPALSPTGRDAGLSAHHQVYGMCLLPSLTNGRIFQRPKNSWLHVR